MTTQIDRHYAGLLSANGHRWEVLCFADGNRRKVARIVYVQAIDLETAERIGQRVSGRRCCRAIPWNPRNDSACYGYVEEVQ